MFVREIEPLELKALLSAEKAPLLLDVRQEDEHELVRLDPSVLIPLMELPQRVEEVRELVRSHGEEFIVYCRSGGRSAQAVQFLEEQGITGGVNLRGGINAYAKEADSSLTPY